MAKTVKRLYSEFQPSNYKLHISPDKDKMVFSGVVSVSGKKVGRPTQRITLHQKGLKISGASVIYFTKKGPQAIEIDRINNHDSFDEVRLHAKEMLYPGQYELTLEFSGTITKPMNGIYPCFFKHQGKDKVLIATQFESHHAREAFPCIDEPEAKATFDLRLTTPKEARVLSNTPIKSQKPIGKLTKTTFETTPIMSSYLLVFVFGDLDHKQAKTKHGTIVRTYATPQNADFTDFALDVAVKCLEFYDNYFDVPFPLKKCDLIALPDFASGAMENWGCITFREQCLLVDPKNTSLPTKQYVAMVVAHELAHMWFGNLVTMRWWTDLWLNEGFASWIEYLAVDHIFPQWQMWTQFVTDEQQVALKLDALEHTHPIEAKIDHPDEIRTIFDTISYAKGSSVIHMLNNYLGNDVFRDGLRYYLKKHAYKNTDTVDLWDALEKVSGKPVKDFMHSWTSTPGYPVLDVSIDQDTVGLKQERFYLNRSNIKHPANQKWPIPLLSNSANASKLFGSKSDKYSEAGVNNLKLNFGQSGFYRIAYNASHVHRLAELTRRGQLSALDRLGVLSDTFELAKAGYIDTDTALDLLGAFGDEENAAVWDVIAGNLGDIRHVMNEEELRESMKPYIRHLVSNQVQRLGWEPKQDESYFDSLLRPTILALASIADEPAIVGPSIERFNSMKNPEDIAPDLRGVIYGTAARKGGKPEFNKLLKMHNASNSSEERTTLVSAITNFKQKELIKQSLSMIISDDVRLQDLAYWVAYSFGNRHAREATWEWMKSHWDWLEKNLGDDLSFNRFPIYAARVFNDRKFLKEFESFFKQHNEPSLQRSIKQGIEIIQWHASWKERDYKEILTFFKAQL